MVFGLFEFYELNIYPKFIKGSSHENNYEKTNLQI